MESRLAVDSFHHPGLHVVNQHRRRHAAEIAEGMDHSVEHHLHVLALSELLVPHPRPTQRQINRKRKTQDGRTMRRYRRRWKVERIFAWMQNNHRLATRWEYRIEDFLGFAQLACLTMLSRNLWDGF